MSRKLQVAGASCGFAFVALLFGGLLISGFIPPIAPSRSAGEVAAFYRDNPNGIRFGLILMMFGAAVTAPFVAAISVLIRRIDERLAVLASTQLVVGAAGVAAIFVPVMLFCAAAFRPERPPDEAGTRHLTWGSHHYEANYSSQTGRLSLPEAPIYRSQPHLVSV
jgi:hypothetical protein